MRMDSSRLYITRARRGPLASRSLASTQGLFSSIYLLARPMTAKTSIRAFWKAYFSIWASYFSRRPAPRAASSSSRGSAVWAAGSLPPGKYLPTMDTVRETRLPRSLARSVLMRVIRASLEKLPSEPKGNSRSRKYRRASTP